MLLCGYVLRSQSFFNGGNGVVSMCKLLTYFDTNMLLLLLRASSTMVGALKVQHSTSVTAFLPQDQAWRSMNRDDYRFWLNSNHLPILLKHHLVNGEFVYTRCESQ